MRTKVLFLFKASLCFAFAAGLASKNIAVALAVFAAALFFSWLLVRGLDEIVEAIKEAKK